MASASAGRSVATAGGENVCPLDLPPSQAATSAARLSVRRCVGLAGRGTNVGKRDSHPAPAMPERIAYGVCGAKTGMASPFAASRILTRTRLPMAARPSMSTSWVSMVTPSSSST